MDLINDPDFVRDYQNLYRYYRDSIFSKFRRTENYLYMIFQTGRNPKDRKAFKWLIRDGRLHYMDDRSVHEAKMPPQFDFDWTKTTLDDRRLGKFPHISFMDKLFIETLNGEITFKIEDNTDSGKGIYAEKVANPDQQLDDVEYYYADLGNLIAVRVRPHREDFRAYVFNQRTKEVVNLRSLNELAILLPENQGIIFSNGYYIQNGTHKLFEAQPDDVGFLRRIASPNGEDFLYIFARSATNTYVLLSYNIIRRAVETPIVCNGFTIFADGILIYFRTEADATRHHQVQIWETPYMAALRENEAKKNDPIYKVGNKPIVAAMAEIQEVIGLADKQDSYEGLYEDILKKASSLLDSYFWIHDPALKNPGGPLAQIREIANTAIDEFVKVQERRKHAAERLQATETQLSELTAAMATATETLDGLVHRLADARRLQGEAIDLKNVRYIDLEKADIFAEKLTAIHAELAEKTIAFLLREEALLPYSEKVAAQKSEVDQMAKTFDAKTIEEANADISAELELLIDILNGLKIEDATQTTRIVERISVVFASLNEVRAQLSRKLRSLKSGEAVAAFAAQMTLLEQSATNYLELSVSAEKAEQYYTKIIVQLEELESRFSEFDDFALQIADKRDEIVKAFNGHREQLIEQLGKRTSSLEQIGLRVLKNIENASKTFASREEILGFYASDLMVDKIRHLVAELNVLNDVSRAENLENLLKKSQEDALRILRDKNELYVDGENVIALGKHRFSVNQQRLSLTLLRRNDELYHHLTGTGFYRKVQHPEIAAYRDIWEQEIVSENASVYRAEYLAYRAFSASEGQTDFRAEEYIVRRIEQRYAEGYIKGVHDHDALLLYEALKQMDEKLDMLRYGPRLRALAQLFWHGQSDADRDRMATLIQSANAVRQTFPTGRRHQSIIAGLAERIAAWPSPLADANAERIADYLFGTLMKYGKFSRSEPADRLQKAFLQRLDAAGMRETFASDVQRAQFSLADRFHLAMNWLHAFADEHPEHEKSRRHVEEAAAALLFPEDGHALISAEDTRTVDGLKGNHPVLQNGSLRLQYHDFMCRLQRFAEVDVPRFGSFAQLKERIAKDYERELKISELEPKVLTSFVRNRLIDEVYFPLIGSNFAKQIGAAGDAKRTARMGMLLLISPPGYGKTTLMEYLAKTLGLHFVKINGPTIGQAVTSIDPAGARTSGEREELKKINLAFEMADNVMLYLDDIQHLNAEFLQKFISLADGQRKMDGIFDGESKTYDLRGKRFCIVMAGNPYTESGSKFQLPDMLANRADVYNLGDVIGDTEHLFNLSMVENATIENPHLEKIASKSFRDFHALAGAEQMPDLEANHAARDVDDFVAVLRHLLKIRGLVVKVNRQYIQSAATQDDYRPEPPFKMQGSYRNMGKLAAAVVPLMNETEIAALILAHYESEAQTLAADAESNLLKLKEIAGLLSATEKQHWDDIQTVFRKNNKHAGLPKDDKVFAQLLDLNENLEGIVRAIRET